RRLARFVERVAFVQRRLQDWPASGRASDFGKLSGAERRGHGDVIVSTSADHPLEPAEKQHLFAGCFNTLKPGGVLINGDEYRPESDVDSRTLLEKWSAHMQAAIEAGRIPESFRATFDQWYDRNIRRFAEPKKSGDDCQETIGTQLNYLRDAGFASAEVVWAE